jgi:hypothetical protein
MIRYARITRKMPREIVLLRGRPCAWSRCSFCDYIDDNTTDLELIERVAETELAKVTGEFAALEVINSGSWFELPPSVQQRIRRVVAERNIRRFTCEAYWSYRRRFDQVRTFFGPRVSVRIKVGVETFDDHLRNEVLKKGMRFKGPEEVAEYTDAICLLMGFRGQTPATIERDIDILRRHFAYGCINLLTANTRTAGLLDESVKTWFRAHYTWLDDDPAIEVLWTNTAYGVG